MKKIFALVFAAVMAAGAVVAQQLPDSHFEDWSDSYDGNKQPKYWHGSNVTQVGMKFTFLDQVSGRSGSAVYVSNREVGAAGITEIGPGYFSLGTAWQYIDGLKVNSATAGTDGGTSFTYRPDSVSVWIKRDGSNTDAEDFHIIYYSWRGTAVGEKYKAKDGSCSGTSHTNEESDIRIALDHNECGTKTKATQIAEGWYRARAKYTNWTKITIPIYYANNEVPQMCNLLFSAGNYPNYRANSGLYKGNGLYVDDVELIYTPYIQTLYVGDKEWKGFDPYSSEEQTYSLGESATSIPQVEAWKGKGQLTNAHKETATFNGRQLSGSEISITDGVIDGKPMTIKVTSGDGKSTHTYKIKFVRAASSNANLAGIQVNGEEVSGFRPTNTSYEVALPYGTTALPQVTVTPQEDQQTVQITQASSLTGKATIVVTAANKTNKKTYTVQFSVAQLADNTLQGITVNGEPVPGFSPALSVYKVSLPVSTTTMPVVKAISAYKDGEQTITYQAPSVIDGGTYKISVTTPGNSTPKVYQLNFRLEASSYSYLKSLSMGEWLTNFEPQVFVYYVNLPVGTTELPKIQYEPGDVYQTVDIAEGGLDGTTRVTVTAGNKSDVSVYKLVVSTAKSEISTLKMIYLGSDTLTGFRPDKTEYEVELPIGTTELPEITVDKGDEYEQVSVMKGGLNGVTRVTVSAQNGNTTIYQIRFSVKTSSDANLRMIYIDGDSLAGFEPERLEYTVNLPKGTTMMPMVTYDAGEYQTITVRDGGLGGEYKITVRPQTGASQTYKIRFVVAASSNTALQMIYVDGNALGGFNKDTLRYDIVLPAGESAVPEVTYEKAEASQRVLSMLDNTTYTLTVTAENGDKREYVLAFQLQKSENAYVKMIYLDEDTLEGFVPTTLIYNVTLAHDTCPRIRVDKENGQQVVIVRPVGIGDAQILVTPETGSANQYVIHFSAAEQTETELEMIYVDGDSLAGFKAANRTYALTYSGAAPEITWDAKAGQEVTKLTNGNEVALHVTNGDKHGVYTITCERQLRHDAMLRNILLDGVGLSGFQPTKLQYTVNLAAGSVLPVVTFEKNEESEVTYFGQTGKDTVAITVVAEDGVTMQTYEVAFKVAKYNDVTLANLALSNGKLKYDPAQSVYLIAIDNGEALPDVIVTAKPGQTTMLYQESETVQKIEVVAESGDKKTYKISYTRTKSTNCLLSTILLDGDTLVGFEPTKYNYVDTLDWRTEVVPNIMAVGQMPSQQTITTYVCGVNGVAKIYVEAESGKTADYTIAFPVRKSSNTALEEFYMADGTPEIAFKKEVTDYVIALPYQTKAVPVYVYSKAEKEQSLEVISRPIGDTTQIIVTAENGDKRTYNFYFYAEDAEEDNRLQSIYIRELDQYLSLKDKTQRTFEVTMPYGSRSLTVEYEKMFPEQTVWVAPGGVNQPTKIMVRGNREGDTDQVYTITPIVPTADPAVLTDILIDGVSLAGFKSEQFAYVVSVTSKPKLRYVLNKGAEINIIDQTSKHWAAEVTYEGRTNTYEVWYYYKNDVVPNMDFTEWTSCAKYTSAQKPTNWNTIADVLGKHGVFTPDGLVTKSGSSMVKLQTPYSLTGGGAIPGFITLGKVTGNWGVAGSSSFAVSGGISFHNSPDVMQVRYYNKTVKNNSQILYILTGADGEKELEFKDSEERSSYKEASFNLSEANAVAGDPTLLNIVFNSYYQISGTIAAGTTPEMYVDWLRFQYNHTLTGLKVNGIDATMSGTKFEVTLTDPESIERPILAFTGEVKDQVAQVTWGKETNGVRTATIRNYAENGTDYTDYTLTVKRPLCSNKTLDSVLIGGELKTLHVGGVDTIYLKSSVHSLPDVVAFPGSSRQTVVSSYADSTYTIMVTAETGDKNIYTIRFVTDLSDDTELKNISGIDGFTPTQRTYEVKAAALPEMRFEKKMDGQMVTMNNGVFTVVAENGAVGQYVVTLNKQVTETSAQISSFEFDGNPVSGFGGDNYAIELARPEVTSFVRKDAKDSVVYTQKPTQMTWAVYGAKSAQHTYTLTYPTGVSDDAYLEAILVNGGEIEGFNKQIYSYTIASDTAIALEAIGVSDKQTIITTVTTGETTTYTIDVTAEDGVSKKMYEVKVSAVRTSVATLDGIYLDGVLIDSFRPEIEAYEVVLPTPAAKEAEPQMPSLTYVVTDSKASVKVTSGILNDEPATIGVKSSDGMVYRTYTVMVKAEESHNANLTGITVNGLPVAQFESGRHYYSASSKDEHVEIGWSAEDKFQKVTLTNNGSEYTIHVTAQDEVTTQDYVVEVYVEAKSSDATLSNILLDGVDFKEFERELNKKLAFSPMKNQYDINLPSGTTLLPEVSAVMKMEGQKVAIRKNGLNVYLDVTAKDNASKNTYTLNFAVPKSSNAKLSMIFVGGEPIANFKGDEYYYLVKLPVGTHGLPEVIAQKGQTKQTVDVVVDETLNRATITVLAEDEVTTATYVVVFEVQRSVVDVLALITASGDTLPGFDPLTMFYHYELSVGSSFPELDWEQGDEWQTVRMDTLRNEEMFLSRQIVVTSEYGTSRSYVVEYEILPSDVDTLMMIYVDNKQLAGFNSDILDYDYILPATATTLYDTLYVALGDEEHQKVDIRVVDVQSTEEQPDSVKAVNKKTEIHVTAQSGKTRVYSIWFSMMKSTDATLGNILLNNKPLSGFESGQFYYNGTPLRCQESVPVVTVAKRHEAQNVEIQIVTSEEVADTVTIHVTAEDGKTSEDYRVVFKDEVSDNMFLSNIVFTDGYYVPFDSLKQDYEVLIPYGVDTVPTMLPIASDVCQTIVVSDVDSVSERVKQQTVTVYPYNNTMSYTYTITYKFLRPSNAYVDAILLKEVPLMDFRSDEFDYTIEYEEGTSLSEMHQLKDVTVVLADSMASYSLRQDSLMTIYVDVLAQDSVTKNTYTIYQIIGLSKDNYLEMIYMDSVALHDFDSETYFYTYYVPDGGVTPNVTAVARHAKAEVDVKIGQIGDTSFVMCTAENGESRKYYIWFTTTTINDAQEALGEDVLLKHLSDNQILVATLRTGVDFALYDQQGHLIRFEQNMPTCDQNNAVVTTYAGDKQVFADILDYSKGVIIHVNPGQLYMFAFYANGKKNVHRGKFIHQRSQF